jgi:hypothetical protein
MTGTIWVGNIFAGPHLRKRLPVAEALLDGCQQGADFREIGVRLEVIPPHIGFRQTAG